MNDIGMPILYFMGIPIVRSDYMMEETDGTGTGGTSNARAKSVGGLGYTIFGLKYGDVMAREPGICFGYGGTEGEGDLYELWTWPRLEDYNAGGMRLDSYGTVLLGSTLCLGRIFDMTDAAITA